MSSITDTQDNTNSQDNVNTNLSQHKVDTNLDTKVEDPAQNETEGDPNWKAFREARKKDRLEREAAERRATEKQAEVEALKAAMQAAFSKQNSGDNRRNDYAEYAQEETEDERIEKKVQIVIAQREAAAEAARLEREKHEYPNRLAQAYPDFHSTISSDNLDYLDYHYPEVVAALKRQPDDYNKWADIYRLVKKFVPNSANAKKDASRAESNFNKPRSMSTSAITQTGETGGGGQITEDRKKANWERMQKTLKGLS